MAGPVRGVLTIVLFAINLFLIGTPILLIGLLKLVLRGETRRRLILFLAGFAERWAVLNNKTIDSRLTTRWDVGELPPLFRDGHYLILSNHISWVDIIVLVRVFHRRVAFLRFFLKSQLFWFPVVGLGTWALEFPFMKRHSAEYLARHPEKRGEDLETTRRACQRYRTIPVAILNFIEGTRFTHEKHEEQCSPYRYLLRPRAGGVSFVLASLGDQLDGVLDVTIAYPGHEVTVWDFVTNRVDRISVRVRPVEVPEGLSGEAITRPGPEREAFKAWIDGLWREKDELLATLV